MSQHDTNPTREHELPPLPPFNVREREREITDQNTSDIISTRRKSSPSLVTSIKREKQTKKSKRKTRKMSLITPYKRLPYHNYVQYITVEISMIYVVQHAGTSIKSTYVSQTFFFSRVILLFDSIQTTMTSLKSV